MPSRCITLLTFMVLVSPARAQQTERNLDREKLIWQQLQVLAPDAVKTFQRATEAMDQGRHEEAVQLYQEVARKTPGFPPAIRRLGLSLGQLGKTDEALVLLELALQKQRSPENLISLARVLAFPVNAKQESKPVLLRALTLAKEANEKYPGDDDPSYL